MNPICDPFGELQTLLAQVNRIEDGLQSLRDGVALETKTTINQAIREAMTLRDALWQIDKALEGENRSL
jgi:prefoldin subunit 5